MTVLGCQCLTLAGVSFGLPRTQGIGILRNPIEDERQRQGAGTLPNRRLNCYLALSTGDDGAIPCGDANSSWVLAAQPPCGRSPRSAQQGERVRRVGVLMNGAENDPEMQGAACGFPAGARTAGMVGGPQHPHRRSLCAPAGRNQYQRLWRKNWSPCNPTSIFAHTTPVIAALQRETRTIPIVFVSVSDPIGSGFIASLARPGGNLTGLMLYEEGITGKWLAMLKEIAPHLARAALMANPNTTPLRLLPALRPRPRRRRSGSRLCQLRSTSAADIERAIASFARAPNGGLVVLPMRYDHRASGPRHRARGPASPAGGLSDPLLRRAGGLMSYGTDIVDQSRQAASYVDRILRGAKPADLPVQAPTKYETTINLKTAKALGLTVPPGLLVAADEVIE